MVTVGMVFFQFVKAVKPEWLAWYFGLCETNQEEIWKGECVPKCLPREIRDQGNGVCLPNCSENEVLEDGKCKFGCSPGKEPDSTGTQCLPLCGAEEYRDHETNKCHKGEAPDSNITLPPTPTPTSIEETKESKGWSGWIWMLAIASLVGVGQAYFRNYLVSPENTDNPISKIVKWVQEKTKPLYESTIAKGINETLKGGMPDVFFGSAIKDLLPIVLLVFFVVSLVSGYTTAAILASLLIIGLVYIRAHNHFSDPMELYYKQNMVYVIGLVVSILTFLIAVVNGYVSVANWAILVMLFSLAIGGAMSAWHNALDVALHGNPLDPIKNPVVSYFSPKLSGEDLLEFAGYDKDQIKEMSKKIKNLDREGIKEHRKRSIVDRIRQYFIELYTTPRAEKALRKLRDKREDISVKELKAILYHPSLRLSEESIIDLEKTISKFGHDTERVKLLYDTKLKKKNKLFKGRKKNENLAVVDVTKLKEVIATTMKKEYKKSTGEINKNQKEHIDGILQTAMEPKLKLQID
jgi:hypothetical protein